MRSNFQRCGGDSDSPNLIGLFLGRASEFTRLRLVEGVFQKNCQSWIWKAVFWLVHELASSGCSPTDMGLSPLGSNLRLVKVIDC